MRLRAPFPWFGGKSRAAHIVWAAFGDVRNYVEPFAGSLAVLLARPEPWSGLETVNDLDGYIANVWRSLAVDPEAVARWADWPVNENDLHARHAWLVSHRDVFTRLLEGDPEYHDPKVAGWWLWGVSNWIGGGWCSGKGPWGVADTDEGRQLVHLGVPQGVTRKRVHLGRGHECRATLAWFCGLQERLRRVRVASGDWSRVCRPAVTFGHGLTGVFLDPPYSDDERTSGIYAYDTGTPAADCREWAIENGLHPLMRIALCGYEGEHVMPDDWTCIPWKANGGYGNQGSGRARENAHRERVWLSPHCLPVGADGGRQLTLEVGS